MDVGHIMGYMGGAFEDYVRFIMGCLEEPKPGKESDLGDS